MEQNEPAFLRVRFYTTLPAVLLLLGVLVYGTGGLIHARLLQLGEHVWPGYHTLRADPVEPTCNPTDLEAKREATLTATPAAGDDEDDLLDGLLDDDEPGADDDDVDLDALLDDDEPDPPAAPAPTAGGDDEVDLDALLEDDETPPSGDDEVDLDALLDDGDGDGVAPAGKAGSKPPEWFAYDASLKRCTAEIAAFRSASERITPGVKRFRAVEGVVQTVVDVGGGALSNLLALLILICAVATTAFKHHIALRPPRAKLDHRISDGAQLVANALLMHSAYVFKGVDVDAFGTPQHPTLHTIWVAGFGVLCLVNLYNIVRVPESLPASNGFFRATLSIPLYTIMALIAGSYFLIAESHGSGLAIYVGKLTEHALLYLNVGLYVWVGMLLKRTKLAELCFDALRPWKLAPELLAFVVVVGAALPTAYSGASGIFVIAAGAVIYRELRKAGARRQLALATTAMSGSMGVVLSPCLLVVIVASLNNEVTTDQLYGWGLRVFLLSAVLFFAVALINRQGPLTVARPKDAMPGMLAALGQLLPYGLLFVALLVAYRYTLDAGLDEHSAPIILPVLMIGVLTFDRFTNRQVTTRSGRVVRFGFRKALGAATSETTGHIGALLMLMGLSICLGGIIERAELMSLVPATFGSVWTSMGLLVVVLVIIGMSMDPYGAVVLVSATLAEVAYRNGIDPVHFWMVVLVAFELGYLTPPVALNHLLTRQVVGDPKVERAEAEGEGFWSRHERLLLPITVMGIALILVAFLPLLLDGYGAG